MAPQKFGRYQHVVTGSGHTGTIISAMSDRIFRDHWVTQYEVWIDGTDRKQRFAECDLTLVHWPTAQEVDAAINNLTNILERLSE